MKDMTITSEFIRTEIRNQNYEISLHADDERIAEKFNRLSTGICLIEL